MKKYMILPPIKVDTKNGEEKFTYNGMHQKNATLFDFWKWSTSDLISNTTRGILVEFIVALSIGQENCIRMEWDAWDLSYKDIKIEVKSASYIQSLATKRLFKNPILNQRNKKMGLSNKQAKR